MSNRTLVLLTGAAALAQACSTTAGADAAPSAVSRSLVLDLGYRGVNSVDHRGDVSDTGGALGLEYTQSIKGGVGWEADLTSSAQQDGTTGLFANNEKIEVLEVSVGARAAHLGWCDEGGRGWQPYASAGLTLLSMQGRGSDSAAVGGYVSGGVRHIFASGFTMGLETKWLTSTSDYVETYNQLSLQFGWSF